MRIFRVFVVLLALLWGWTAQAQEQSIVFETTSYRQVFVYVGPSITYPQQVDILNPGVPVQVVERNSIGNWVRVQRWADGELMMDGWILSGYLNSVPELQYGDLPVTSLPDAAPENVNSPSLATLYQQPVIPTLSAAIREVFERGQAAGNHADVITKVGDSLSASVSYITIFSEDGYALGPYGYLEPTLLYYRDSTAGESIAAQIGMSTYVVFDPFWATDERCEPNESPLACEYRVKQPSVAFILFGPNDVRSMTETEYHEQMRMIIEETLAAGIIPVLMTFSAHPDAELYWQAINFNIELVRLTDEYEVPLINLWAAVQPLPEYGLDEDRIHLAPSGFTVLKYDTGHEAFYGISLQNLLVLRTLDEIRLSLGLDENP
ncbi:MAG: hypothetical protein H6672_13995 [Anaerolineaceae bacterium]|nr:hypothetical protein [Anaerolineaceae bacterium]